MEKRSVDISPFAAITAVVASFIMFLFLGVAFFIFFGIGVAMVLSELLFIVIPLGYMLYRKVNVGNYIGLQINIKNILLGVSFGAFLLLFSMVISAVLVSIFGVSEAVEESNKLIINMSSSTEGLLAVIASSILAGICEEFTFRGFLQNAINRKYSLVPALLVSSLAWGLGHFDPQGVYTISAFLMGLVLGYIYYRWNSYTVSVVAHASYNLIVLALLLLL